MMHQRLVAVALCAGVALTFGADTGLALNVAAPEALVSADDSVRDRWPSVAYDSIRDRYLVVWSRDMSTSSIGQPEIHARLIAADGEPIGAMRRVSDIEEIETGPESQLESDDRPVVVFDAVAGQFLIGWDHCTDEVICTDRAKRLSADGVPLSKDIRPDLLSAGERRRLYGGLKSKLAFSMRTVVNPVTFEKITLPDSSVNEWAVVKSDRSKSQLLPPEDELGSSVDGRGLVNDVRVAFHPTRHEVLVVYTKNNGEDETEGADLYARRIAAAKPLTLTVEQVQSNQRIGQAALRRVNAIQAWLDAGLVRGDIKTGSIDPRKLAADVPWTSRPTEESPNALQAASPRPMPIPRAQRGATTVTLTARQMRINQRIYSAALRKTDALTRRLDRRLTGGDIRDGTLDPGVMVAGVQLEPRTSTRRPREASKTVVERAKRRRVTFAPTIAQLSINRRIAQQALRRADTMRTGLLQGLSSRNFNNGSISAVDFAP